MKNFMTTEIRLIQADPATKRNLNVANAVQEKVDKNEYKRKQVAPGVKLTEKAFGKDRRMPITNTYIRQSD